MKQHLTVQEWGEFERANKPAAELLRRHYGKWQSDEERRISGGTSFVSIQWEGIWEWFTIGRMIEYLNEHNALYGDEFGNLTLPVASNDVKSLCNALWQAVKEVLK